MKSNVHTILRAQELAISFDGRPVLKRASLELARGSRAVLLGDNGAGKTTFLKIAALVLPTYQGTLELFGVRVRPRMPRASLACLRRKIGVVWQQPLLEAEAPCWENVSTTALYSGIPRDDRQRRTEAALEAVGLLHRAADKAGSLNGGDKKKLALAQAIVRIDDGLLLLDEPTAYSSPKASEQIRVLLQRLNETRNCTILAITHDLDWAARFSEAQYRLTDGRVILEGGRKSPSVGAGTPSMDAAQVADAVLTVETSGWIWQ